MFPHYTIEKNILLGSNRNKDNKEQKLNLKEIIDLLDILHILKKYRHMDRLGINTVEFTKYLVSLDTKVLII